ncbi:MAG TPA: hypothetical protein VFZ21_22415 [Gemmatimonadaceae bacterium]|nr:hypothetical protein [Gemmatimonadaceae bacterium]
MTYQARHPFGSRPSGWTRAIAAILTLGVALACSNSDSPAQPGDPDDDNGGGGAPGNPSAAAGMIAYVRGGEIRLIKPDGTGDRLLWRAPQPEPGFTVSGMAWRPDGAELAFASNHEMATSWFERDVYTVGADGSGLRRLTNAPAHDKLAGMAKGTVTVRVQNVNASPGPYFIYVAGAAEPQQITVGPGTTRTLTFTNVADLGPGVEQVVVAINGISRWFGGAVADVQSGRTADAGLVTITAFSKIDHYGADAPFWRADGSRVGYFSLPACFLMEVSASPPAGPSQRQLLDQKVFGPTCAADWGPTPATADQLIYLDERNYVDKGQVDLYRVSESASTRGQPILTIGNYVRLVDLRWLPNGSGFLYARQNALTDEAINIHAYDFASRTTRQVTQFTGQFVRRFAISPDGRFVVFERVTELNGPSDLWVMGIDGSNPRLLVTQAEIPAWNPRAQ